MHNTVALIRDEVGLVHSGVEKYGGVLAAMGDQSEQNFARLHKSGLVSDSKLTEIQEGIKGQEGAFQRLDQTTGAFLNQLHELLGGIMKNRNENQEITRIASRKSISVPI